MLLVYLYVLISAGRKCAGATAAEGVGLRIGAASPTKSGRDVQRSCSVNPPCLNPVNALATSRSSIEKSRLDTLGCWGGDITTSSSMVVALSGWRGAPGGGRAHESSCCCTCACSSSFCCSIGSAMVGWSCAMLQGWWSGGGQRRSPRRVSGSRRQQGKCRVGTCRRRWPWVRLRRPATGVLVPPP